jgi:DNA-binding SARP family transcriptional activator
MLQISLFASLHATLDERPLHFSLSKERALFAYLLLKRGRPHARSTLEGLFWGDVMADSARHSLRTALWRLRSMLEPAEGDRGKFLQVNEQGVGFVPQAPYWLDSEEFERRLRGLGAASAGHQSPLLDERIAHLSETLALYRGDLLEGMDYDWSQGEQARYRTLFLHAGRRLMDMYLEGKHYEEALACGQRLLVCDPVQEPVHRRLMETYYWMGDRPAAIRQYRLCQDILNTLLQLEPMHETVSVHEMIRKGTLLLAPQRERVS